MTANAIATIRARCKRALAAITARQRKAEAAAKAKAQRARADAREKCKREQQAARRKKTKPRKALSDAEALRKLQAEAKRQRDTVLFIPDLPRALRDGSRLLRMARSGAIELRPESGAGLLTAEQRRDLLPQPGNPGGVLSYLRVRTP